jgi:hypothetical protein
VRIRAAQPDSTAGDRIAAGRHAAVVSAHVQRFGKQAHVAINSELPLYRCSLDCLLCDDEVLADHPASERGVFRALDPRLPFRAA